MLTGRKPVSYWLRAAAAELGPPPAGRRTGPEQPLDGRQGMAWVSPLERRLVGPEGGGGQLLLKMQIENVVM